MGAVPHRPDIGANITSTVLGPYPALVLQERTAMRVLRFS